MSGPIEPETRHPEGWDVQAAVQNGIVNALQGADHMLTKFVCIVESIDKDGERPADVR